MNRWIKHWQALPTRNRVNATIAFAVMIAGFSGIAFEIRALGRPKSPPAAAVPVPEALRPLTVRHYP
jgi:hypothetical protein